MRETVGFAILGAGMVEELLSDPTVDVICICTPTGQHAAQAIAAANAGKHVLVEKPMALRLADADDMIAACDRAGVKLGVVLQQGHCTHGSHCDLAGFHSRPA